MANESTPNPTALLEALPLGLCRAWGLLLEAHRGVASGLPSHHPQGCENACEIYVHTLVGWPNPTRTAEHARLASDVLTILLTAFCEEHDCSAVVNGVEFYLLVGVEGRSVVRNPLPPERHRWRIVVS